MIVLLWECKYFSSYLHSLMFINKGKSRLLYTQNICTAIHEQIEETFQTALHSSRFSSLFVWFFSWRGKSHSHVLKHGSIIYFLQRMARNIFVFFLFLRKSASFPHALLSLFTTPEIIETCKSSVRKRVFVNEHDWVTWTLPIAPIFISEKSTRAIALFGATTKGDASKWQPTVDLIEWRHTWTHLWKQCWQE